MTADYLFRYTTEQEFFDAMTTLGVPVFPDNRHEEQLGACSCPPMVTHQGTVRMVRLLPEQAALIPDVLSPTFVLDWVSSEEPYEDNNPEYTADLTDPDGNLYVGTVWPGRIGS